MSIHLFLRLIAIYLYCWPASIYFFEVSTPRYSIKDETRETILQTDPGNNPLIWAVQTQISHKDAKSISDHLYVFRQRVCMLPAVALMPVHRGIGYLASPVLFKDNNPEPAVAYENGIIVLASIAFGTAVVFACKWNDLPILAPFAIMLISFYMCEACREPRLHIFSLSVIFIFFPASILSFSRILSQFGYHKS